MKQRTVYLIALLLIAACQPNNPLTTPTDAPLPTVTVGQVVSGHLSQADARPVLGAQPNPATAVALANRPTAAPDMSACPAVDSSAEVGEFPDARMTATGEILRYLNSGGTAEALPGAWDDAFDRGGYVRDDVDLTGEGVPEIVLGYTAPGDVGTLAIFGCEAGVYTLRYEIIADGRSAPELIWLGETNNNPPADAVFSRRLCTAADVCEYQTQVLTWSAQEGRFVNLLDGTLSTLDLPAVRDMDNDNVAEIVVNLDSNGTSATGPLRTGVNIYDWNGRAYTLSIIQLNPPRYRIQVVHEADKEFSHLRMQEAIPLYELALSDDDLRYWFNDGPVTVTSYAFYRLVLAYAHEGQPEFIADVMGRMLERFPLPEGGEEEWPIYVQMAFRFVDTLTITNNLNAACSEVRALMDANPEALRLLNRYGSRSPTYTALDVCPF